MTPLESTRDPAGPASQTNPTGWIRELRWQNVLIGLAVGLCIGLVMGWIIWPVQWTNALPGDLNPEAKAHYLAAVAESYVYYKDDLSAEIARNRLYDLNEDLGAEIADAQAYFGENPQRNSRVYISNLGQLAQTLGAESPDIVVDDIPGAANVPSAQTPSQSDDSSETTNWLAWLFTFLAAVILVGGGIYIIGRLAQRRQKAAAPEPYAEEFDDFDDDDYTAAAVGASAPGLSKAAHEIPAFDTQIVDDYGFDTEEEDGPTLYSRGMAIDELTGTASDEPRPGDSIVTQTETPTSQFEQDEYGAQIASASTALSIGEHAVHDEADSPTGAAPQPKQGKPGGSPGMVLATFAPQYQAGDLDFEQSFNILDEETGYYVGECGMGVNMKNGVLQNNPENVIALDVWLFDKKTDKTLSSQTRVLLSEYAIDHDLEPAFTRERQNESPPVVAQPGVVFQLKGQNLIVDCRILEAQYTGSGSASGIFQNVKVEMTVRAKE